MQTDEASDFMYEKSGFKHKGISRDRFLILFIYLFKEWGARETARELCYFLRGRKIQGATFSLYD